MKMPKIGKELVTQKIDAVSVVECTGGIIQGITSFKDNKIGNREAEMLFHKLVKENYPETLDEEIEVCLDNGYFDMDNYMVSIVHSN